MISLDTATRRRPMTLPEACRWLGQHTGKVPATSTIWRWTLKGVRGGIRLEAFTIGGTRYTTPEMIERFIERTSAAAVAVSVTPVGVEVSAAGDAAADRRREQIEAAQRQLKDICAPKRKRTRARHGGRAQE